LCSFHDNTTGANVSTHTVTYAVTNAFTYAFTYALTNACTKGTVRWNMGDDTSNQRKVTRLKFSGDRRPYDRRMQV
jgi:hypothetical protein